MSQWNNTYSYNNQYQAWNGDPNVQYVNQAYYPNRPEQANQYVSFNEFLSQMQNSGAPSAGNYTNAQYENYPARQYNYQNVPSTAQNPQLESYGFAGTTGNVSIGTESYPVNVQSQYNPVAANPNAYTNAMILKSNLTPTATEFVPKGSMMTPSTSTQNIPESSAVHDDSDSRNNYSNESRNHYSNMNDSRNNYPNINEPRNTSGSSSDTNWRERSQSSQKSTETSQKTESYQHPQEHPKKQETNGRHRETKYRNNESNGRHHDLNTRNQDSNSRNQEPDSHQHDSSSRNYESNNRNYDSSNKRGQGKGNYKSKNKDDARTFYNSAISKDSQDVRNGRGEASGRGKNWVGTPRLRAMDRNSTEDAEYANTYLQGREERIERDNRDRDNENRERDIDRGRDTRDKHRDGRETYERDRDYRDLRETDRDNRDIRERDRGNRDIREKDRDSRDRGRDYRDVRERDRDNRDIRERDRDYRDNRERDRDNRDIREIDRDYRDSRDMDRDSRDIRERDRGNRDIRERERDTRDKERAIKSENVPSPARTKTRYGNEQGLYKILLF